MITYYGYKISPNQIETDEGFLICKNVPIARTGEQDYLGTELGLDTADIVKVYRPESEVFSPETIASFEGKPVTDDHPSDLLDTETATIHSKGHAQNVRRGAGEWKDYLVADLHIHDAELIREIKDGKREVSCGYMVEYVPNGDGTYTQKNIRGNHIAVVNEGRAGHSAAIMDNNKVAVKQERKKSNMSKKNIWSTLFGAAAEGKSAEEISQLAIDTAEAMSTPAEKPAEEAPAADEDYRDKLFESIDALGGKIDKLCDALMPKEEPQEDEDPIEAALNAMEKVAEKKEGEQFEEEMHDGEEAVVVPADEMDGEEPVKAILKAVRPAVANITDSEQRKAVSDALINALMTKDGKVKEIVKTAQKNAQADRKPQMNIEDIQNAYNQRNPHLRKENK